MWETAKKAGVVLFLIWGSAQDIREKKISAKMVVLSGVLFFLLSLVLDEVSLGKRMENMTPGMAAFVIAFLTREQVGYGDAACLIVLGSVVSAASLWGALMGGLLLLSLCSAVLLLCKKAERKTTLPFIPFLTAGMLWQMAA